MLSFAHKRFDGVVPQPGDLDDVVEYLEETRSHQALTYNHSGAVGTCTPSELPPGQSLRPLAPLFKKPDESVVEEEYARLEG